MNKKLFIALILLIFVFLFPLQTQAQEFRLPDINLDISTPEDGGAGTEGGQDLVMSLRILLLLTVLTLAPAILVMVTSFTRIAIVLSIVKRALSLRKMPPSQVMVGLAIFLTIFIMAPVWQSVNSNAIQPYMDEEITTEQAVDNAVEPLRDFMFKQTREKDLSLFVKMTEMERPESRADVPIYVLIPAFVISELKIAFQIGFIIYIPFLMIDMVVASILMSMGMMMLPPVIISLPFKLLLFVLADGWYLVIESLVKTFN
jgi:flagellar biosynthetic protein FliP